MSNKQTLRIPVTSNEKVVTVDLRQDFNFLEILSLKFTQEDVYSSGLCSDYGVVAGRVSANNGMGVPNAKVSIFVPLNDDDELDPILSALYPFKQINDKDDNNYRYNLLPKRKQHGGHVPTGTFYDQEDILTSEVYLEVFEKYYNYTVKTNESGDFMIWGVPVGTQTINIDIDLSDIGTFSLRPYDFIRKGTSVEKFDRYFNFKSSTDIDGLPQIVNFKKNIEVFPFIGNEELCEIGISRVDYDLTESDITIEPVSIVLVSSITDDDSKAIKKNGKIKRKMGYKCNLITSDGIVETVRFTGNNVYGSDGTLYPELEYYPINEGVNENGVAMIVLPMNLDYIYTNEFGEKVITSDKNKGVPTKTISRFRIGLNNKSQNYSTAKYLIPNIREFNFDVNGENKYGEYNQEMLLSYMFSDVFEDYIRIPESYSEYTGLINNILPEIGNHRKSLILNNDEKLNELKPLDYFYKFSYGKVYTISSFQGSYDDKTTKRYDAFLGIKEIRPDEESDCAGNTNYFPVNYAYKNTTKFSLIISQIVLFLTYVFYGLQVSIGEILGKFLYSFGVDLWNIYLGWPFNWRPFATISEHLKDVAYKLQSNFTINASLKTYPDCEECGEEINFKTEDISYCPVAEIKLNFSVSEVVNQIYLYVNKTNFTGATANYFRNETDQTTFSPEIYGVNSYVKESIGGCSSTVKINLNDLINLHNSTITDELGNNVPRYYGVLSSFNDNKDSTKISSRELFFKDNDDDNSITFFSTTTDDSCFTFKGSSDTAQCIRICLRTRGNKFYDKFKFNRMFGLNTDDGLTDITTVPSTSQFMVLKIYDKSHKKNILETLNNDTVIEQGCSKYDKFYDDDYHLNYLWSTGDTYDLEYNGTLSSGKYVVSETSPSTDSYSIISDIGGSTSSLPLPLYENFSNIGMKKYNRQTITGKSEIRDGIFTIIPVINGDSKNLPMLSEWYRRKGIGLAFCSGIINYSFIDNWLNGVLYFFKFRKRIIWDNEEINNLSQRPSKYPRDLVFFNVLDNNFYYRSTPYNPLTKLFNGMKQLNSENKLLLHPTTFYDVGVRDEFFYEICSDPNLDPTCSVIRDITSTSYQDPANIIEYGLMYRGDISKKTDIGSFFNTNDFNGNTQTLDGDFLQHFSINCEVGIEEFDLDSPQYFMYNNEIMDPEINSFYFTSGMTGNYGPLPIDFKIDKNGKFIRGCMNNRLGDYSQNIPFYLWDKQGEGFGQYGVNSDTQKWDRTNIAIMPLQRMYSINNINDTTTNYLMNDDEEEYLLRPMTITHPTTLVTGNFAVDDIIERFDNISTLPPNTTEGAASGYTENEIWLKVTSGTTLDPLKGDMYIVVNKTWKIQTQQYINGSQEVFLFETKQNYSGTKQVLSTPFMFYFGLKPQNTSLDLLKKYYGDKGDFIMTD